MSNPFQINDKDNELLRDADEYLRKHKLLELFEVSSNDQGSRSELIICMLGLDNDSMLQAA